MPRTDGRYAVVLSKGEKELVEAAEIKVEGGWITLYNEHQPVLTNF